MPYISPEDRALLEPVQEALSETGVQTAGEAQYVIAMVIGEYLKSHPYRYQTMNDIMGALAGAQQEFYRRHVGPYEDVCIGKNGDVPNYGVKANNKQGEY